MSKVTQALDDLFEGRSGVIPRDLKLNLKRFIEGGVLERVDALLTVTAVAAALDLRQVAAYAESTLRDLGTSEAEIQEARESAAIMGMLNTYYRFKHLSEHADDYRSAGLRMTIFSNPVMGKTRFEMLAFAVSVLNGCGSCIRSHEQVLRSAHISADKVHDLARLASIMKGVKALNLKG
jgi:alkyl hydroperoxide reductase subunit D